MPQFHSQGLIVYHLSQKAIKKAFLQSHKTSVLTFWGTQVFCVSRSDVDIVCPAFGKHTRSPWQKPTIVHHRKVMLQKYIFSAAKRD